MQDRDEIFICPLFALQYFLEGMASVTSACADEIPQRSVLSAALSCLAVKR